MKGIHHILHTLDRALCHDINILVPMRTAHQDDIIRIILSDFRTRSKLYLQVSLSQQFCSGLYPPQQLTFHLFPVLLRSPFCFLRLILCLAARC